MPTNWNGHDLVLSRKGLDDFYSKSHLHTRIKVNYKLSAVEEVLFELTEYVHWPALENSFAADAKKLQAILDRME